MLDRALTKWGIKLLASIPQMGEVILSCNGETVFTGRGPTTHMKHEHQKTILAVRHFAAISLFNLLHWLNNY